MDKEGNKDGPDKWLTRAGSGTGGGEDSTEETREKAAMENRDKRPGGDLRQGHRMIKSRGQEELRTGC